MRRKLPAVCAANSAVGERSRQEKSAPNPIAFDAASEAVVAKPALIPLRTSLTLIETELLDRSGCQWLI
jgi:hypothetical protein